MTTTVEHDLATITERDVDIALPDPSGRSSRLIRGSFLMRFVLPAFVAAFMYAMTASSAAGYDPCRDALCFADKPHARSCRRLPAGHGLSAEQRKVRCFVFRAARHFRWPVADALYVSFRESRWTEVGTNYAGYRGPFQMSTTLMGLTPYRAHDRNQARWASLAFVYLSARRGLRCSWNPPGYCA